MQVQRPSVDLNAHKKKKTKTKPQKTFHIPCSSAQNSTSWPQTTFLALSLKILVSEYFVPTKFFYSLLLMPFWHSIPLALEYLQLLSWLVLIIAFKGWLKCQVDIYIMCVSSTLQPRNIVCLWPIFWLCWVLLLQLSESHASTAFFPFHAVLSSEHCGDNYFFCSGKLLEFW